MRYGFINNFSQTLAADLDAGATTMTLDGGGADLSAASAKLVYVLTLDDGEGTVEIVHVTGVSGNDLTIERSKEGTTDAAWPTGTTVEMRVTSGVLGGAVFTTTGNNTIGLGASVTGAVSAIALGPSAAVTANYGVALGEAATASGSYGFALGPYATASGTNAVAVGYGDASGYNAVAIGEESSATLGSATAVGAKSEATAGNATALGQSTTAQGSNSTAIGDGASARGDSSIALGSDATAYTDGAIAIGENAGCNIAGGMRLTAIPYVPNSFSRPSLAKTPATAYACAPQVVLMSYSLDLTDGASATTRQLPAGLTLFMTSIDVIVTGSEGAGGSPEIVVGADENSPDSFLAATPVTITAVGSRQTHTPAELDGVTGFRVATTVAGTGTTYAVKLLVSGYVMGL